MAALDSGPRVDSETISSRMSKYDNAKTLKLTKAGVSHACAKCGQTIQKGDMYYRESLGLIPKPLGMTLHSFCRMCIETKT